MGNKLRLIFFIVIVLVVLGVFVLKEIAVTSKSYKCKDCNVILISIDTLRADHIGAYGYYRNTSPNIDKFAEESILFENAYSQSSFTLPSHMSIFTSLYPSTHKIEMPFEKNILHTDIPTLAEILQKNNYTSIWVAPLDNIPLNLNRGFERGFDEFYDSLTTIDKNLLFKINDKTKYWNNALKWIRTQEKDKKFFMFLHSYNVHYPYTPNLDSIKKFTNQTIDYIPIDDEGFIKLIKKEIENNTYGILENKDYEYFNNKSILENCLQTPYIPKCGDPLYKFGFNVYWKMINLSDKEEMDYIKLLYDAEIYEIDLLIKDLLDTLKNENLLNNTIIIITSDHGEEFGEHNDFDHAKTLYEEVIKVPLIIWAPNLKDKKIDSVVQSIDIMPTLLDIVGIPIPKHVQGISLLPFLTKNNPIKQIYQFSELKSNNLRAIRFGKWEYIMETVQLSNYTCIILSGKDELFNLDEDPGELTNLVYKNQKIVKKLRSNIFYLVNQQLFNMTSPCKTLKENI